MLKTFTLKQFDIFRNEVFNKIKTGTKAEKIQGLKNLIRLSAFFVLANAGADELKDLLLGRKTDLEDRTTDNMLRLFGVSKYITWQARTEGVGTAAAKQILPPFKFINSVGKDLNSAGDGKGLETVASIPIVGKLAYWHMGRGTSKREDLWDNRLRKYKRKYTNIQEGYEEAADKSAYRQEYLEDLKEHRRLAKLQGVLNKYKRRINLLAASDVKDKEVRIKKLSDKRIEIIKRYLENKE